jgi:5'-deoxynucleotidase YfbR-like HD superfamily hydrolase
MTEGSMNLKKLRGLAWCERFNYHPRNHKETVDQHSYWVAIYTLELCKTMNVQSHIMFNSLRHALLHDVEEAITNDIPGPVKRGRAWKDVELVARQELEMPEEEHDPLVKQIVKAADLISALVFADEEVKMGNWYFKQIRAELLHAIQSLKLQEANNLVLHLGFDFTDAREYVDDMSHL